MGLGHQRSTLTPPDSRLPGHRERARANGRVLDRLG